MQVGVVSQLYIYPIKSHAARAIEQSGLNHEGLIGDRRWMWVDEEGTFLTQRHFPQMCLWEVSISESCIRFSHRLEQVAVEAFFSQLEQNRMNVRVWSDSFETEVFGGGMLAFMAQKLFGKSAYLAYLPLTGVRTIEHSQKITSAFTSFADSFPFLIANEASVNAVNAWFEDPISMLHFRPNIVVAGFPAFAEDRWKALRIGGNEFLIEKSCSRCSMVNVVPTSGEWRKEVLPTLARTRTINHKVMFGKHALLKSSVSELAIGQRVEIVA
jgi:uncharacterized protein